VIGLGLRQVQDALNRKANAVQQEFIALSERIDQVVKDLLESRDEERKRLREEQTSLRSTQQGLADEINLWRERARDVLRQSRLQGPLEIQQLTPTGRLIERSRTEYDLRGSDQSVRQREAVNFANRPGIAQDDEALGEIEAAMNDPDPLVRELAVLTNIQIHRFRAIRVADLDIAHEAVQHLSRLSHPSVIPVLVEILENPRTGFTAGEDEVVDSDNNRSRMVALLRLVEWHTAEAKNAVFGRKLDLDSHIAKAAERSLELFPGPWSGPLKGTGPLVEGS